MRILPARALAAFLIFFLPLLTAAQDKPVQIPPSPDAGHLGTYGEFEVNKTTGSANISIPLMELKEGGISIPITLSYQSAGLRPADRPSWVGMDWVLSGGGVISRTMRGQWDDMSEGFLQNLMSIPAADKVMNSLALPSGSIRSSAYLELQRITDYEQIDYEPDAFAFNFGPHGGSFFFGNDGNVHTTEHTALKFVPKFGAVSEVITQDIIVGWTVTDENGLIYTFDAIEITDTRYVDHITPTYVSSWYLTSIYNPLTKTTATFTYSATPFSVVYEDKTHTYSYNRTVPDIHWSGMALSTTTQQTTHSKIKFLTSITLNDHTVQFFSSASPEPWKHLDEIQWSHSGALKKFQLSYEYTGTPCDYPFTGCQRSRLLSVTEYHATDPKVYSFEYYPGAVPNIKSNAQDHWGFFNGQSNTNLVPSVIYMGTQAGGSANRTPSFSHMLIGMLKKITYPTKGSTTFTYGQNTWEDEATEEDVTERTEVTSLLAQNGTNSTPACVDRTVHATDPNLEYTLEYTYDPEFLDPVDPPFPQHYPYMKIFEVGNSTPLVHHIMEWSNPNPTLDDLELDAGESYRIEVCAFAEQKARITDIFLAKVDPEEIGEPIARTTGGLRLAKIENTEPETGAVYTRTFDYGFGGYHVNTSLASDGTPVYGSMKSTIVVSGGTTTTTYTMLISSSPVLGLSSASVPVAYEKVTEWLGTPSVNTGRIETIFMKQADQTSGMVPQISRHAMRSKVKIQNDYDQAGNLVKKDQFNYNALSVATVRGFRAKRSRTTNPYDYINDFSVANYNLYATWYQVASQQSTLYTANGAITSTTSYTYDTTLMHTKPVTEKVTNSAGDEILKQYKFPTDITACEKECYKYYHEDLSGCNGLTNIFAKEATSCAEGWNSCKATYKQCMRDALDSSAGSSDCLECRECAVEFAACSSDHIECLDNLGEHYEFESCQKQAFMDYMLCQSGFRECVHDELITRTDLSEKANSAQILGNWLATPIEVKTFNGVNELTKTSYQFNLWNDTVPLIKTVTNSFQAGPAVPQFTVTRYDAKGNPTELIEHKEGFPKAYLWGYDSIFLIAEFQNAAVTDVGHSSFESTSNEGNLSFTLASSASGKTGWQSHLLNTKPIMKAGLTSAKRYKVSYWAKSGVPSVNGVVSSSEQAAGADGWKYYEKIVTGITTLTISGTGTTLIDDVRVGPEHSVVTTFVHKPGIGILSTSDPNHLSTYYAYDTFGRLTSVKDHDHNLIRLLKYNYKD